MEYIMIGLLLFSIFLLVVSLFLRDPYKEIKNELDQLSMQQIQELYQIKRKMKILEEELLIDDKVYEPNFPIESPSVHKKEIHAIIKNQVWSLAGQGLSIEQISKQSSLTPESVQEIIQEFSAKGAHYE